MKTKNELNLIARNSGIERVRILTRRYWQFVLDMVSDETLRFAETGQFEYKTGVIIPPNIGRMIIEDVQMTPSDVDNNILQQLLIKTFKEYAFNNPVVSVTKMKSDEGVKILVEVELNWK